MKPSELEGRRQKTKVQNRERVVGENARDSHNRARFFKPYVTAGLIAVSFFPLISFAERVFSQSDASRGEMAAAEFPKLAEDYLLDLHARHPTLAAASGIHAWDAQLEDYSPLAISNEIAAIKRFQYRLAKIPPVHLGLSDAFDYQILDSNMKSRLLELEQIKSYERNPQLYGELISTGLLQLAIFPYSPPSSRIRHLIAKQKLIPRLLESARGNIRKPPAIFVKVAIESFKGTLSFINNDLPRAFASVKEEKLQREFKRSTKVAADAVAEYIKHLERIRPDASVSFAIERENFAAKLKHDEGIDVSIEALLRIARRELERTQYEFRKQASIIDHQRDPQAVWASIQAEYPPAGGLVDEAQKQLSRLVRFIQEKEIVTLPEDQAPTVALSPEFLRWSTASMWTPGPFESRRVPARYLITDVDPKWGDKQREEYLKSLNYSQLWTTSIHEAYPGHFIQGAYLRGVKSQVRRVWALAPTSFVEGWAHYTEQMMLDEGFGDRDPKLRMGQLADALLRLCRSVVAIRLHTEGMTVEEGTQFFMQNGYMGETPARLEAERATFDPMCAVYSFGKLAIMRLREDYKRERGSEYSLREFHDQLLGNGNAPIWIHRRMMLPGDRSRLLE